MAFCVAVPGDVAALCGRDPSCSSYARTLHHCLARRHGIENQHSSVESPHSGGTTTLAPEVTDLGASGGCSSSDSRYRTHPRRNSDYVGTVGTWSVGSGNRPQSAGWCQHSSWPELSRCLRMPSRSFLISTINWLRDILSRSSSTHPSNWRSVKSQTLACVLAALSPASQSARLGATRGHQHSRGVARARGRLGGPSQLRSHEG